MNRDAGRGNWLFVTVQSLGHDDLLFLLDTGASITCFDKSLESRLGPCLGTCTDWHLGVKSEVSLFAAPELYLGGSRLLKSSTNVITLDLKQRSADAGYPVMGILGMDVLEHYCVQLNFAQNRIRFLDGRHANPKFWGKPFPLTGVGDAVPIVKEDLLGGKAPGSLIDSGYNSDGWLQPAFFEQWTNHSAAATNRQARFPRGLLDGEVYPEIDLDRLDPNAISSGDPHMRFNGIGLRFLSRHLVTLDFPNRTMYLKRTSLGPLSVRAKDWRAVGRSAFEFLESLKKKGQLPGWSAADRFASRKVTFRMRSFGFAALDFLKRGDPALYHYQVTRDYEEKPWSLQKAWKTDQNDHLIEEYTIP